MKFDFDSREGLRQMGIAGALLVGFAVPAALILGLTYGFTKPKILANQAASLQASLNEILPRSSYDNNLLDDQVAIPASEQLGTQTVTTGYRARRGDQPLAVILSAIAPDGYSGNIELLIGIKANGELAGIRPIKHKETPGLGDKIEARKTDWVQQFPGRSLSNTTKKAWAVKKDGGDFDALTGATITPRAVVSAVQKALLYFAEHRPALLAPPTATAAKKTTTEQQTHQQP